MLSALQAKVIDLQNIKKKFSPDCTVWESLSNTLNKYHSAVIHL